MKAKDNEMFILIHSAFDGVRSAQEPRVQFSIQCVHPDYASQFKSLIGAL